MNHQNATHYVKSHQIKHQNVAEKYIKVCRKNAINRIVKLFQYVGASSSKGRQGKGHVSILQLESTYARYTSKCFSAFKTFF